MEDILQRLEATFMTEQGVKATLGDYIRLVQLRKELGDDEPREIKVTWVDTETEKEKGPEAGTEKESDSEE